MRRNTIKNDRKEHGDVSSGVHAEACLDSVINVQDAAVGDGERGGGGDGDQDLSVHIRGGSTNGLSSL